MSTKTCLIFHQGTKVRRYLVGSHDRFKHVNDRLTCMKDNQTVIKHVRGSTSGCSPTSENRGYHLVMHGVSKSWQCRRVYQRWLLETIIELVDMSAFLDESTCVALQLAPCL